MPLRSGKSRQKCSMNRAVQSAAIFIVAWLLLLGGLYVKFHAGLEDHANAGHASVAGLPSSDEEVHNRRLKEAAAAAAADAAVARRIERGGGGDTKDDEVAFKALVNQMKLEDAKQAKIDGEFNAVVNQMQQQARKDAATDDDDDVKKGAAANPLPPKRIRKAKVGKGKKIKPQFEAMDAVETNFMKKQVELLKVPKAAVDPGLKVGGKKGFGDGINEYKVRAMHKNILRAAPALEQEVVDEKLREDPDLPDLPLPEFWMPKVGQDLDSIGSRMPNGDGTIYVAISSYRDALCKVTLANLFIRAEKPDRLTVGVVEQNKPEDPACLPKACEDKSVPQSEWEKASLTEDEKVVCMRRKQIRIFHLRAYDSLGPTYARHIGHRMYRGEFYALQVDAHISFVNGWDTKLVTQWKYTGNERAVISAYPEDLRGAIDANGDAVRESASCMCSYFFEFSSEVGLLQHHGAHRINPRKLQKVGADEKVSPMLHAFWAAGMSFSRGHFVVRVPYDPHTPMMFQGEEIHMAVRAWTSGYDFYTSAASVLYHPYNRKNKPVMFWENEVRHPGTRPRGARRIRTVMGCDDPPDLGANLYEIETYNLGYERPLEWFYHLFGIDCKNNKATKDICPFVTSGQMHFKYSEYLPRNKLGIDYSQMPEIIELEKKRQSGQLPHLNRASEIDKLKQEELIASELAIENAPNRPGVLKLTVHYDGTNHDPDLPAIGLPRFWKPPDPDVNLDTIGTYTEDGIPTIYISIASYRDGLCFDTIANAFERTKYPDRLQIGAVEQNAPGDPTCLPAVCEVELEGYKEPEDPRERLVCSRRKQIRLFKLDAEESLGPTFARHIGSRLYRGEYYSLQIDAHITFVNNWDELIIAQWKLLENERAVLSTYLKDTTGATNEAGDSIVNTTPVMCDFSFQKSSAFPIAQFKVAYDVDAKKVAEDLIKKGLPRGKSADGKTTTPLLHALWAAGMSFSRGHFTHRIPYDPHFAMMFQGEEALITIRSFTHGYDIYSPSQSVMFHPYKRKNKPKGMFWENGVRHKGAAERSAERWRGMLWCDEHPAASANMRERSVYGLGNERPVVWWYHLFGMDCVNNVRTKDICPETWNGAIHEKYNKHLRPNKMGIDYYKLPEIRDFISKNSKNGRYARSAFTD